MFEEELEFFLVLGNIVIEYAFLFAAILLLTLCFVVLALRQPKLQFDAMMNTIVVFDY